MKDSEAHTKPTLAVNKYIKNPPPRHEPETGEAKDAYENAHAVSREALMLQIRLANGELVSFPYSGLRMARYTPKGLIELRFDRDRVIAEGRNLLRLHDSITQHRQRFIQEGTDIERGLKDDGEEHIDHILITGVREEE